MGATVTVTCDRALGGAPEWVHLLTPGRVQTRDTRSFIFDDPRAVIEAFEDGAIDLPIDYEHQNDTPAAKRSGPVPAAGWIKELTMRDDGLWGRVEWTPRARQMIAAREYRYLSPSLIVEKDSRRVIRLKGAGLVHNPALHITALAREDDGMSDFMKRIAQMLELGEDADEAAILDALEQTLKGRKGAKPDPREYVPAEAYREALSLRRTENSAAREARAWQKASDAVRDGHITPAAKEWAVELCLADEPSFDAFLASSPAPYAHLFRETHTRQTAPGRDVAARHDPDVEKLAAQLGIPPERLAD